MYEGFCSPSGQTVFDCARQLGFGCYLERRVTRTAHHGGGGAASGPTPHRNQSWPKLRGIRSIRFRATHVDRTLRVIMPSCAPPVVIATSLAETPSIGWLLNQHHQEGGGEVGFTPIYKLTLFKSHSSPWKLHILNTSSLAYLQNVTVMFCILPFW